MCYVEQYFNIYDGISINNDLMLFYGDLEQRHIRKANQKLGNKTVKRIGNVKHFINTMLIDLNIQIRLKVICKNAAQYGSAMIYLPVFCL